MTTAGKSPSVLPTHNTESVLLYLDIYYILFGILSVDTFRDSGTKAQVRDISPDFARSGDSKNFTTKIL